ncbi:MAG: ABC transporter substrate-binding protein [Caldilineaceae bacterium]|nr:ABC transporter substrate-binding protein [Caldilineaceae bacterium]
MHPFLTRQRRMGVLLLLFVLLLAACAPTVAPAAPAGEAAPAADEAAAQEAGPAATLRIGILGDESTLTPYTYVTGYPGWNMLMLQYDSLYQLDLEGVPQPWLVSAASTSDDGLTITLDLKEGIAWHDGEPFSAEDVKFSIEYYKQYERSRFTRALLPVESVAVEGNNRVVLTLSAPSPSFELGALADVPILPQHIWAEITTPEEQPFDPVVNTGAGPYKLVEYAPDQFYRFEANADYFAGAPAVNELVFVKFADDAGSLAALRSGEVDMLARPVAPEQIEPLAAAPDMKISQGPLYTTQMLNYDMTKPPFDRPEVRQAMSLAIDRQDLVDTIYLGAATLGSAGWIHPASPLFNAEVVTESDPARAQQILEDAGITDGDGDGVRELDGTPISFEFLVNGDDSLRLRLAELVSEMLAEVGIQATVSAVEQATWEEAVWPGFDVTQGRNYEMAMWGWSAPVQADAVRFGTLIHSDPAFGNLNLTGYANSEADALAEAIATEIDAAARAEMIGELQTIVARDLPFIMLLYPDGAYAYNASVYDGWAFMTGQGVFHKLSLLPEAARP